MNDTQRDMMLHALGGGIKKGGRNYYCAAVGQPEEAEWNSLVALGLAKQGQALNGGKARIYFVTPAGVEAMKAEGKL